MSLNLEYLVPEKYRSSEVMTALLDELEVLFGEHVDDIDGLLDLLNPETVPNDYMQYLADLLGTTLTSEDNATEAQRRTELVQAVDWIKLKGTYQSIKVIGLALGLTLSVADMYCSSSLDLETNYNNGDFVLEDWFIGHYAGDNPPDLDSTYIKSPHFGIQVKLNVKYPLTTTWIYAYLWIPEMFSNLDTYVEKTRPIHTVPHYYLLMEPEADDNNQETEVDGEIKTAILGSWTTTKQYFDAGVLGSGEGLNFDDGNNFDLSQDAFYNGISKWVLGTGSKGSSPVESGWSDIETPVSALTGTVDDIRIYTDRIEWEILVPAQTCYSISELGLYTPGTPDILRIACLFPDINLNSEVSLRIIVTINRI